MTPGTAASWHLFLALAQVRICENEGEMKVGCTVMVVLETLELLKGECVVAAVVVDVVVHILLSIVRLYSLLNHVNGLAR